MHFEKPFVSIGTATALIVERLTSSEHEPQTREHESEPGRHDDADAKKQGEYVRHRLREIRSWEKRIDGRKV